jgi:hypothetical protein
VKACPWRILLPHPSASLVRLRVHRRLLTAMNNQEKVERTSAWAGGAQLFTLSPLQGRQCRGLRILAGDLSPRFTQQRLASGRF